MRSFREKLFAGRCIPLPRHLTIEITSCCNLKCPMCPKTNGAVNTPENRIMSRAVFDTLKPLFPAIESLELNGLWGEAFLHPDLYLYMLKELKGHGIDVYTISNGTLLKEDLARQLVELQLNRLVVSLDAATPETYARLRPPGCLDQVVAGLERLKEWKEKLGRDQPRLELAFLGMKSNMAEFPDFVRLAHRVGAYKVFLQALGEYERVRGESVAKNFKERGRHFFEEGLKIGRELGMIVELLPPDQFEEDRGGQNCAPDLARLRKHCFDLWNKAVIATTGDVLPCCASPHALGNLGTQSFREIWYGRAYSELRRQILSGDPPAMCRTCTGMSWVEKTLREDGRFYFYDLVAQRWKLRLKRNPWAHGAYRALKSIKRKVAG